MNIDSVRVRGLFDHFDHHLEFRSNEHVMIMIGPNGFGKTTTLRLINALFNQPMHRLTDISFRRLEILFDCGTRLVVEKEPRTEQDDSRLPLKLVFQDSSGGEMTFRPPEPMRNDFLLSPQRNSSLPSWLQDVRDTVRVRLIDTDRLMSIADPTSPDPSLYESTHTIRICSHELADLISKTNTEYATLSQSLDRTFPIRLVSGISTSETSAKTLIDDLDEIRRQHSLLEKAGLLPTDHGSIEIPDIDNVDAPRRDVLAMYAQDTKQKLAVFDDLYPKIEAFMKIANSRLRYKQVSVTVDGMRVVSWTGADLDLNMLSSGEQHELIILYELLFRTSRNTLILIDEPELSLHVAWQEQFVGDLQRMADISHFRAILATHSPEIIADRWDLTVELNGPNGA